MKHKRQFPGASPYTDRHGKRRWRFRKKGFSAELGADYGSDEFVQRYEAAVQGLRVEGRVGAGRTKPGSIDALIARFYRSPTWLALAESTKITYRGSIEPFRKKHGRKRVAHMERRHVVELLAELADTPSMANKLRKRLLTLMDFAIELGWRADNPVRGVKPYKITGDGFHTWDEGEIMRYIEVHPKGTNAHLALVLMLYTGAARADAVKLGWGNVKGDRLTYRRQKTETSGGILIDIPVHPMLSEALAACPREAFTFLQTAEGRSRSPNGLGNAVRKWCDDAGLPNCSSHGLRKACARRLAEAGATPHEIQAVTGHKTLAEVERYTAAVNRAGLADRGFERLNSEQKLTNLPTRFAKRGANSLKGRD